MPPRPALRADQIALGAFLGLGPDPVLLGLAFHAPGCPQIKHGLMVLPAPCLFPVAAFHLVQNLGLGAA